MANEPITGDELRSLPSRPSLIWIRIDLRGAKAFVAIRADDSITTGRGRALMLALLPTLEPVTDAAERFSYPAKPDEAGAWS